MADRSTSSSLSFESWLGSNVRAPARRIGKSDVGVDVEGPRGRVSSVAVVDEGVESSEEM